MRCWISSAVTPALERGCKVYYGERRQQDTQDIDVVSTKVATKATDAPPQALTGEFERRLATVDWSAAAQSLDEHAHAITESWRTSSRYGAWRGSTSER